MSITQEQIINISKNLSKLNPKNIEKLYNDVNSILWYVDLLSEVDTTWVTPTVWVITKPKWLKEDIENREIQWSDLLKCSNQKVIWNQIAVLDIMK